MMKSFGIHLIIEFVILFRRYSHRFRTFPTKLPINVESYCIVIRLWILVDLIVFGIDRHDLVTPRLHR